MWEQIRANRRRSYFLIVFMALLLMGLGYTAGEAYVRHGGLFGVALAMGLWIVLSLTSFFAGDKIMLMTSRAREISHDDHPRLFNVVEEMKIAAGLPKMPKVYIIDEAAPNAFATGRKPENAAVAITTGLLKKLNRDELQGVIAHEISHIGNRDILYVTLAGVFVGSIAMISHIFLRGLFWGGGRSRRSSGGGGQAALFFLALALIFAILGPIAARLLYFALSRKREFLADANGALLTRYPEGLASALEKIAGDKTPLRVANSATAPMFIINPMRKAGLAARNLTSTHPPIDKRIGILRSMGAGASLLDYDKAWQKVSGKTSGVIPPTSLRSAERVAARRPAAEPAPGPKDRRKSAHDLNDLVEKINNYAFLACVCGLRMKIPPNMKEKQVKCPRCKRVNEIPVAELATVGALAGAFEKKKKSSKTGKEQLRFVRKDKNWTSFQCACNNTISLSPAFRANKVTCPRCKRSIEVASS